ncbi:hypothetical protein QYF36_018430 [Acer negundo]|nr:hypothetical protein QYF36_018430 [Acer negundo]
MISKDTAMAEKINKVTIMLLKVDLGCYKCYRKVKRTLSKFPQIQDEVYDEKNNTVMIKVAVCCSPEKLRDDIWYKGRESIKSIEILKPPEKPKAADPPKPVAKLPDKPKVVTFVDVPKPTAPAPALAHPPGPAPALAYPPGPVPIGVYCPECSEWRGGGPVRYCDGYCGRPVYDSWGGGGYRPYYGSHYNEYYFNDENSQSCTII